MARDGSGGDHLRALPQVASVLLRTRLVLKILDEKKYQRADFLAAIRIILDILYFCSFDFSRERRSLNTTVIVQRSVFVSRFVKAHRSAYQQLREKEKYTPRGENRTKRPRSRLARSHPPKLSPGRESSVIPRSRFRDGKTHFRTFLL